MYKYRTLNFSSLSVIKKESFKKELSKQVESLDVIGEELECLVDPMYRILVEFICDSNNIKVSICQY